MSLDTWRDEFYPDNDPPERTRLPITHSLRKWRGLRKEALERHGLLAHAGEVHERDGEDLFVPHAGNCALCEQYLDNDREETSDACDTCPLYIAQGAWPCHSGAGAWQQWTRHNDPEAMIASLERTLKCFPESAA